MYRTDIVTSPHERREVLRSSCLYVCLSVCLCTRIPQSSNGGARPFGHNRHGPKRGGGCCAPFGFPANTKSPGPRSTCIPSGILVHPAPSSSLATTDMGRKLGLSPPFEGGEMGPHLTQCGLGRGLASCQVLF